MDGLHGAVALVTGAARADGIGQGIARALLESGAAGVLFTDIDEERGRESARDLEAAFPGRALFQRQDVTAVEDWEAALETVRSRFGRLHILVNNAGIPLTGDIRSTSLDSLRQGMAVNFDSQFIGIKLCAPMLARHAAERKGGATIINNSSMAAYLVDPGNLRYHVSKAAVRMLTMCAAKEFGPERIRVNSVHYGPTMTGPMEEALGRYAAAGAFADADAARAGIEAMSPLGTTGTIAEAGALVAFLASDQARYITGAAYWQDGGCFMQY